MKKRVDSGQSIHGWRVGRIARPGGALGLASALLVMLTACASQPRIVTKQVSVPIAVACAPKLPPEPPYAADIIPLDSTLYDLVRALLIDRIQRQDRQAMLEAVASACGS